MQIREWVESFCKKTGASGQLCFDFMYDKRGGSIFCIEANPRTSTNLMAFYNHPKFAAAYYKPQVCCEGPSGAHISQDTCLLHSEKSLQSSQCNKNNARASLRSRVSI